MKKKITALLLVIAMALTFVACANTTPSATKAPEATKAPAASAAPQASAAASAAPAGGIALTDIKVGFLYVGPVGDEGYSYAHDQGRKKMEKELGVKTMIMENVPENADCETAIKSLIDQGCNVIVSTSFGFMDYTLNVAKEYPKVKFMHCSGYKTADNMSTYFGKIEDMRYLSGIAAGLKTKSGKIGYVAAMPIPEVIRGANAFTLGVRSVKPDATVEVVWTNSWYDPAAEKAAALELLNKGCDVLGQHCDTTGPQIAAQEKGAFAVGYNAATLKSAPKAYLTAPLWDWGAYYIKAIKAIADGTWKGEKYWGSAKDGIVLLDELSANCAEGTKEKVAAAKTKLESGELKVFAGELKDNTGAVKVAKGSAMTDDEIWNMSWFVEGVIGTIPKSK